MFFVAPPGVSSGSATPLAWPTTGPTAAPAAGLAAQDTVAATDKWRLSGPDRRATAVEISKRSFPDGASVVYLARQDVFADALAAGSLSDGPVLLLPSCRGVPVVVAEEIARLAPERVTALGGDSAVCEATLDEASDGRAKSRLAGANREGTAVEISKYEFPAGPLAEVYVANSQDSPDAVAGGVLTAGPVLLVRDGRRVPAVVAAEIARLSPKRVVGLGGDAALADETLGSVAAGRTTDRLAGPNRYATAVAIGSYQFSSTAPVAYLARGDVFADAVAAGSLTDGPVFLVSANCGSLPAAVSAQLAVLQPAQVIALGGTSAVCEDTLDAAVAAVPAPDVEAPGPVSALTVAEVSSTSVTLSWTNPDDGNEGLEADTQYSYTVFTRDTAGNTNTTGATLTTTTAPAPDVEAPGPVSALTVAEVSSTSVTLSWTNPDDADLAELIVRRAVGGTAPDGPEDGEPVALGDPLAESVTDEGLEADTQYSYTVFTRDTAGNTNTTGATLTTTTTTDTGAVPSKRVCGTLTASETWSPTKAQVYVADCTVTISSGVTLTVEPGTVIKAASIDTALEVSGSLVVAGSQEAPVVCVHLLQG
nr:cell wall-binding repeat-containing protein [Ornithinimicrobium sediminis]